MKTNTSKLLLSLACLILMIGNKASAQTNVSGGIFANTIWTKANSPYIVTDSVVVFGGITLTIQPGVVVKFDSNTIIIVDQKGKLFAKGTSNDSIIFTSNSVRPYEGIYKGLNIFVDTDYFTYCRFSYAHYAISGAGNGYIPISHCLFTSDFYGILNVGQDDTGAFKCIFKYDTTGIAGLFGSIIGCDFIQNGQGINTLEGSLLNCTFRNNDEGVRTVNPRTLIAYCIFDSNKADGLNSLQLDTIKDCSFKYNGVGFESNEDYIISNDISDNYVGIETFGSDFTSCNTICNNTHYNIVALGSFNGSMQDNYWCLPDSAHIQATIYDAYQNINLGFEFFTPFDTVACANVYTKVNELPASSGAIKVYPNPGSGKFTFQLSVVSGQLSVEVYNVLGERVKTQCIASLQPSTPSSDRDAMHCVFTMDLSANPNGIYFYRVVAENGEQIGMGKVVIQK